MDKEEEIVVAAEVDAEIATQTEDEMEMGVKTQTQ